MKPVWNNSWTWVGVVCAAVALAFAAPHEAGILGRLPGQVGSFLGQRAEPVAVQGDPRLLVLVSFHRDHRKDVDSWIEGLSLHQERGIDWVRMPVIHDPGDPAQRAAVESRLLARYVAPRDRERLVPVFMDIGTFLRSTGLPDEQRAYTLVIRRSGEVLARIPGAFDPDKGQQVQEILQDPDL